MVKKEDDIPAEGEPLFLKGKSNRHQPEFINDSISVLAVLALRSLFVTVTIEGLDWNF